MAMSFCCASVGTTDATASGATEKNGQQISNTLSGHNNDAQRSRRRMAQKAVAAKVGHQPAEEAQTMLITSGRKQEQQKTVAGQRRQIEQRWRHHEPNWPLPLRRLGKCQQWKSSVDEGGLITVQICAIFSWLFPSITAGFHQHRTSAATASSFFLSMLFLCLFILLPPKPAVTAYSAYSAVSRPCLSSEFECGCGQPRCVPSSVVSDGAADCADATDELEETWEDLCGDGTPSRRSATWRTRAGTARLCPKARARECPAELGQVCVEFDARPRCVCRLGFFRAPGLSTCVPTEAFPHFDASAAFRLADALRRGEQPTTNSSCSRLFTDLARLYPALFLFNGREDAKNSSGGTIKQRDELMETDRQLTIRVVSPARGASSTRARSPPDAGRQTDLDGTKRVVPTTEPDECDAEERTSGCGGDGRICAAMKQRDETADKGGKGTNGSDKKRKGICVVPVNECADETLNDCDQKARCIDNDFGFECLCPEGFIDTSPNPHEFPGRKCRKLINECLNPLMNDCSPEAECVDELIGFSCHCKPGRSDISPQGQKRPGRKCSTDSAQQRTNGVDECLLGLHDCHPLATCVDLTDGFRCECLDGLIDAASSAAGGDRPGRNCTAKNTSALFETQADIGPSSVDRFFRCDSSNCDPSSAQCVPISSSQPSSSVCRCRAGLVPLSATDDRSFPFRCGRPPNKGANPCQDYSLHDCDAVAECDSEQPGFFQCKCPRGYVDVSPDRRRMPGRKCKREENECALGRHNCDANAECVDTAEGFTCRCKSGWTDVSEDKANFPGRSCRRSEQCRNANCAPEAECNEGPQGPVCRCLAGFLDVSAQHGKGPGKVCRLIQNECNAGKHDCSRDANCIDTADAFTCRCKEGFRDDSPSREKPGRVCTRTEVPDSPECDVNDPMSCDKGKHEACLFISGSYHCSCPMGYGRLPDGRCLAINECEDARLNECSEDAECIDQAEAYTCKCKSGFADISPQGKPGTLCRQRINECAQPQAFDVDCDANAICIDTEESFSCRCRPGFADISEQFNKLPGRRCVEAVNECLDRKLNDCSDNAQCEDSKEGYTCKCRAGFLDASENAGKYPGRVCIKSDRNLSGGSASSAFEFAHDTCDPKLKASACKGGLQCTDRMQPGTFVCACPEGQFLYTDGTCRLATACVSAECDKNAICVNVFDSFRCQCKPGYWDMSPDPETKPGRACKELINECATDSHDCSPFAECVDATDGYACVCRDGFVDSSSQYELLPGRKCSNASNECTDRSLNTCDENADCVDTPAGYSCKCIPGYVDVSSSANLPPGRVCTVVTTCPKQKTDLMFLIDGSGSIGSAVFRNEVLRFVRDFVELFDIGLENTRVGLIQYSDQIRHEFDLNQYVDKPSLLQAIAQTQYLTGLTRTGAAIQHMVVEGFSERRGARPVQADVSRVAIVITDGRSQDNVTEPAKAARHMRVNMFSIGVTDHVLASELEAISGSAQRWFYVDRFKDLDMRLRSIVQKLTCPQPPRPPPSPGGCSVQSQIGCDRTRNEHCELVNGKPTCRCPGPFARHPQTGVCGGDLCNPELPTSCPHPELCAKTPFSNFRCVCPAQHSRDHQLGICLSSVQQRQNQQHQQQQSNFSNSSTNANFGTTFVSGGTNQKPAPQQHHVSTQSTAGGGTNNSAGNGGKFPPCAAGTVPNPRTGKCAVPGSCDPAEEQPCDVRKREKCLLHSTGQFHACQCLHGEKRHPATEICLRNECLDKRENDCDRSAKCIDTDESYICACPQGFLDQSPDPMNKPGRLCVAEVNECALGQHRCSPDAICEDTPSGYVCRCKPGFIDLSTNPRHEAGIVCKKLIDECARAELNTCHPEAICVDTHDSYKCICKPGYDDLDEFRNPGRQCVKVQRPSKCQEEGKRQCDKNARCFYDEQNDKLECVCPPNFRDKSPDPILKPGRVCIPLIPECDNPTLNDCDSPDRAICTDTDEGYMCRCRQGFLDISPNITIKPGRLCKSLENECVKGSHDCARDGGICEDTPDSYTCRCAANFLDVSLDRKNRPGRNCKRLIDECASGQNDCFPGALCTDTEDSYTCACPPNHLDVSPDSAKRPGRRCLLRVNECNVQGLSDCSPNANCQDTDEGYNCTCADGFVDESPDRRKRPGRVCRPALVDECQLHQHDCHSDAQCVDLAHGFTCQCLPQFLDESPDRVTHPGRLCVPRPTQAPEECQLGAGAGCNETLHEVCRVIGGVPKCSCPINYERDTTNRACTVIDECQFPQLNDCHPSAECTDLAQGYTCKCRSGFRDVSPSKEKPGRVCRAMVNECQFAHLNDCHQNAQCLDLEDGYQCKCENGFKDVRPERPGRLCQQMVNECARADTNSCDKNAKCVDEENGYRCECKSGFADVSPTPTLPGRACRPIVNECAEPKLNDCDRLAKCVDMEDGYRCECPANSRDISPSPAFPGRVCHIFENECLTGKHDCDPQAQCHDNEQAFTCECPEGFTDRSPNKQHRPGRVCVKLVDECKEDHDTCSPNAECRDLEEGYTCECRDGYVDRSPNLAVQPGRVCGAPETCPANHDCSAAAVCEPQGGNKYTCTCIQGYVDQSPDGLQGRICVRNSFCRDPKLNNCSRKAVCYEEGQGYRCECARGYVDKSPDGTPKGRVCELPPAPAQPQRHPCQDGSHDCHTKASCRAVGATGFVCECLPGYEDKSPDPKNKGGRVCLLTEPICLDNTRNDCHPAAICAENAQASGGYTCRCRDGYVDQSPDKERKAGRICVEYVNECLDRSLNDCDPLAVCEDLADGYTCRCAHGAIDQSPDKRRPGRKCFAQINECANPSLNNCSRFADCFDKAEGFECRCRAEYHDEDPKQPGTSCKYMQNECLNPALNDCSPNAECIDLAGGYTCKCKAPNEDKGPKELPGRVCLFNECADPKVNKCDKNAHCEDTEDGYNCRCNEGFYDESSSKGQPAGHYCIDYQFGNEATPVVEQKPQKTLKVPGTPCGHNNWCLEERKEVCVGGVRCLCRPGEGRGAADQKCVPVERTSLAIRVSGQAQKPLFYNSEYGDSTSSSYVELVHEFQRDIGRAVGNTSLAPRYVTSDVSYVTHPKAFNSSWSDGLLINFTIGTHRGNEPIDRCELWKQLISSLHRSNGSIGNGRLSVASDVGLLDPCAKPAPPGEQCNGAVCKQSLGEVCIGGELCGCPTSQKRASADDQCRLVESFTIPLWVLRRGVHNLVFNSTFANPIDQLNKEYVRQFSTGVAQCYPHTALRGSFVVAEVNEILDPMFVNASWDTGLLFNATMSFRKGTVRVPADAYNALIRYVIDRNGNQLGSSGLFLSPYQQNPFSACFKNNCHPRGICVELGPNAYRCECSAEQRDLNPADPGRKCVPTRGYNECEREEDNECSENARCIDLEYLYKCECLRGYTDAAPKGSVPGSLCMLDYCSDVSYCPANSTCVNTALQAECHCNNGFTDIRRSESRLSMGLSPDQYCLNVRDIDECALGLHNCSTYATCTNLPDGYTCQCPAGWEDGNPELPGRICASKLCAQCSEHGSCIPDPANSTNVVCQCFDGYAGTFCEIAPSALPLVLAIILALLFLLLALWSLLFLCTKCRCFKRRRDFSALDQSASSESGADFTSLYGGIPRPKLKSSSGADSTDVHAARLANYLDDGLRIPRAQLGHDTSSLGSAGGSSEYTIREEIERRVITDVTRTEEIVTDVDVHDESGGGGGAGGQTAAATPTRQFQSSGGGGAKASTSVNINRSGDVVGGERRRVDERERDESVAEFANSRGAGAWGGTSTATNAGGGTQLDDLHHPQHHQRRHGGRNGANGGERHNRAFAMVGEEERSLGGELSADDLSIYDKNTMMSRHREFHPMDGGMERFSTSEVSTTKTKKTSREMRK